ncbi:Bifunctional protein: zinc-containing alcohol dehydrogenase; quinone oxidoreductase (NADPH:quinone reductase); Similar to arginate lyase [Janthinobacterium sp. CG23_2]|nr:Bifunctional protein: zinc-containing alcohol dehydrogenase; quinone oxidoreductase (NADPH:quinone reductase); Similar to arginate lyase [Janthinobacterium sp. CG23_2]CUU29249.1 Bifunctional protein: zinc-containing alcohol dehydrogenase; quinone oxidoreductase (NADPH:quinone reductase); Similar to arginate lyase [Janthinobacterium sp. CG23_2]
MKAIRIHAYGDASQMQLEEVPVPSCGPNDVLVRVIAAGINPIDWKIRSGNVAHMIPKLLPFTSGSDAAGVVTAVGGAVTAFSPGDEVFFYAEFARGGTYADYVAVDAAQVALKPRTVSFTTAAALPIPGLAAWTALIETAQLARGMRVLIHGGAGALGSVAVQLAKAQGAHVTSTVGTADVALVQSLGADEVIDYRMQKFEQIARNMDVVLDTLGGATQEASWATLRAGGLLVATTQPPSQERAAAADARGAFVFSSPRGEVLTQLAALVDSGKLRVLVGQEFALADAAQAHRLGESGKTRGKMILRVSA